MDVLSDILASMRLTGGVVIEATLKGPHCLVSQFTRELYASYFPAPAHIIAYHYVRRGRVWAQIPGQEAQEANAGCIILLPRNDQHLVYSAPGQTPVRSESVITPGPPGEPARIDLEGDGPDVALYCGFLGSTSPESALIQSLPGLMLIHPDDASSNDWLESSLRFAAAQLHGAPPSVVARLTELLFGEAVRRYVEKLPHGEGGWLEGLRDPAVAKALSIIHTRYTEALDVESLAREVGVSRSVFAERFTALIHETPMRYCARWRMRMAANLLRDRRHNSGNVAYEVGFNSEAAFTRAFKREYGEPPAAWRRRMTTAGADGDAAPAEDVRDQCISADGTLIAWSAIGSGFPLLQPAVWFHDIDRDRNSAAWGHWVAEASRNRRLIRSDLRGAGRSDLQPRRWTFDALVEDFEAVVQASGVDLFDVLAPSHGALVALAYAARHPGRIRKLVLYGGYAAGFEIRADPDEIRLRKSLLSMGRLYRDGDRTVFGRMLGALYWPGARGEVIDWFNDRLVTIMALNEALQDVFRLVDLRGVLSTIRADTLVGHSAGDRIIPHACSRDVAAGVPGARFLPVKSDNHLLLRDEPAWPPFTTELRKFLDD